MRFKLRKNKFDTDIDITHNNSIVMWAATNGNIGINRHNQHPLTSAYTYNAISISSNRIDYCRIIGLVLFTSLVLL